MKNNSVVLLSGEQESIENSVTNEDDDSKAQHLHSINVETSTGATVFKEKASKKVHNLFKVLKISASEVEKIESFSTVSSFDHISSIQLNEHHEDLIPLKQKLNWIGYSGIKVNKYFGSLTQKRVKEFQVAYELSVTGMIDGTTKEKIREVFNAIYKQGSKHNKIKDFKRKLNHIGFGGIEITPLYGSFTTNRIKELQSYYGLSVTGEPNLETLNKINEILSCPLQLDKRHKDTINLKRNLNKLGYGRIKITNKFGKLTETELKKFQKDHNLPVSGIADKVTLAKIEEEINYKGRLTRIQYDITLDEAINMQMKTNPQTDLYGLGWVDTINTVVETHLNPTNFIDNDKQKFQLLDLSRPHVTNVSVLNKFLKDKNLLKGKGQAFIDAGIEHGINEVYLITNALVGTMDGTNNFEFGIPVNNKGEITYIEVIKNGNKLKVPAKTHDTVKNVFNIYSYAFDSIKSGVKIAFEEGWDTPEKAIIGGAKFVKEKFIGNDKNTFYKMRWNPAHMDKYGYADNECPKDIGWAAKQIDTIYNIYQQLESYILYLEIPVYKK